jgi:aminopeptidase N
MAWWDDTWLNEAMATWLDAKITSQVEPAWNYPLSALSLRADSMQADELASAKRLREPITSSHDIENAFDGALTYYKGSAVAAMFEHWLGAETFQRGLRRYMSQHAFGSATADDFLGALDSASGKAVGAAYRTFLDQPGLPEISAECKAGRGPPALELSQRRFVPIGSEAPAHEVYGVPVCVKYGSGKATGKACTLLAERTAELPLEGETRCPDWVMLNEGAAGYYHSRYRRGELDRLLGKQRGTIDEAERLMLVYDVEAAVTSGALPLGEALGLVSSMVAEKSRPQVLGSQSLVRWARRMLPDALQPKLAAFVQRTYGPLARELGLSRKPGEGDAVGLLRPVVLWAAARGDDPALLAEAKALAPKWLDDRRAVDRWARVLALYAAARTGDRALWERVRAEAKKTADRQERADLLEALGEFRDPALLRESFALVLGGEFDLRESFSIVATALEDRETRDAALEYVKSNFDALVGKMRSDEPGRLLFTAPGAFCDEAHRADAEAFFGPRAAKLEGAPRRLANTLDQMSVCIAQARVHEKSVEEFLDKATAATH